MTKQKVRAVVACFIMVGLVGIDQLIKQWAITALETGRITVIPNLFYLTYVENYGAAFGILQGKTAFLAVIVSLVVLAALVLLFSGKIKHPLLYWAIVLVIAGGVGNLIDRIFQGYVVDYLDFSALFNFPVFNFADCCVVVGTFSILIYTLFFDNNKLASAKEA